MSIIYTMQLILVLLVLIFNRSDSLLFPLVDKDKLYNYIPEEDQVTFHLYDKKSFPNNHEVWIDNVTSLENSPFYHDRSTIMIIHGWTHGRDTPWVSEMAEVLCSSEFWNVIVVDWSPLSRAIYVEARIHHDVAVKQVIKFLTFLHGVNSYLMSNMHIVGHSMGAQIAGSVGHDIQMELQQTIGRISGLDPAAPLYEWPEIESLDNVLDPSDASFVDVIHTNAGRVGMLTPAGHVDFYPNGGERQWGCTFWGCSHLRACEYFIASIRKPYLFRAYSYESLMNYKNKTLDYLEVYPMGIAASPCIPNGIYFLQVKDEYQRYTYSKTSIFDSFAKYLNWNSFLNVV